MKDFPAVVGELVAKFRGAARSADNSDVAAALHYAADELESTLSALTAEAGKGEEEPGAVAMLVSAANAVLAANPSDDTMWSLEAAVAPFNARKPDECANGCPPRQVCDYCQVARLALSTATPAGEWREIESAPKDGTGVLVFDGSWITISAYSTIFGWVHEAEKPLLTRSLTHWQPLPAPPLAASPRGASAGGE